MAGPSVETPAATAVPERTHDQRMKALKRANEIRTKRAKLKRDLKAGKAKIETLLLDPPEYVMSAKAFDMILAVPKYGRVKANRILGQCRISPSKTIGGLSERQRAELVNQLRRKPARGRGAHPRLRLNPCKWRRSSSSRDPAGWGRGR
jgi:hypothetical protein